jgi:hypothetical protein
MRIREPNEPVSDNDWESIKRGSNGAIELGIAAQMNGRSCAVVLVGGQTATRRWVRYEIEKAREEGLGVEGIGIHGLKNRCGQTSVRGADPFDTSSTNRTPLSRIVKLCEPLGVNSKAIYADISKHLVLWSRMPSKSGRNLIVQSSERGSADLRRGQ